MSEYSLIFTAIAGLIFTVGALFFWFAQRKIGAAYAKLQDAQSTWKDSKRTIENERREAFIKLKDEIYRKRKEFEFELKRERLELDRLQGKLSGKYENMEKRETQLDDLRREQQQKVLDFTLALKKPPQPIGEPAENLLQFIGLFPKEDLEEIARAIEEDCEKIDYDEW